MQTAAHDKDVWRSFGIFCYENVRNGGSTNNDSFYECLVPESSMFNYISFLNRGTGREKVLMHFQKSLCFFLRYKFVCKLLAFIQSLIHTQVASNWIVYILQSSLQQYKYSHSHSIRLVLKPIFFLLE